MPVKPPNRWVRYKHDKPQIRLSEEQKTRLIEMLKADSNVTFVDFIRKGKK